MKFDMIIGNPPYQQSTESANHQLVIYQLFIDMAKRLNPRFISVIIPARWYIASGGAGMKDFTDTMINDKHIKDLVDFREAENVFPGTKIQGGVCYFLRDRDEIYDKCHITLHNNSDKSGQSFDGELNSLGLGLFIRNRVLLDILGKVLERGSVMIEDTASSSDPYGFAADEAEKAITDCTDPIKLHRMLGAKSYVDREELTKNCGDLHNYRVISATSGASNFELPSRVTSRPFVIAPNEICTATFIVLYSSESKEDCENCVKYLMTKFARALVYIAKPSQHIFSRSYRFVPMQDFSVCQSDSELYNRYGLDESEIDYIESSIKSME